MRRLARILGILALVLGAGHALAAFRFPMPEFESSYRRPATHVPVASPMTPLADVLLLTGALAASAWAVLRRRSRRAVLLIAAFSLLYFGFYRRGCVCPVGSLQNVLNAFVGEQVAVPFVVSSFFVLPLLFALYFGRVFCAAVCPLGAIQEFCAAQPVQVPRPVDAVLGLLAYAYLGLVVLGIATGSGFLICRYDPFVGFFRQGGSFNMLTAGGILLVAGVFIARPYCRYLCPYGVLLRWVSPLSRWHASITPAGCIQCRLCEESCPYNAIEFPPPLERPESRHAGARRLGLLFVAVPIVTLLSAGAGWAASDFLARMHPAVRLAKWISAEDRGELGVPAIDIEVFRAGKKSTAELYAEADDVRRRFAPLAACFGAFMGLVVCAKLIRLSTIRGAVDYEPDRGACLSCARCFAYCPVERTDVQV